MSEIKYSAPSEGTYNFSNGKESVVIKINDNCSKCVDLGIQILKLQNENETFKKACEDLINHGLQQKADIQILREALDNVNNDLNHFHYCTSRYLEVGAVKQNVVKIGTPIRAASKKITEALAKVNAAKSTT